MTTFTILETLENKMVTPNIVYIVYNYDHDD